MDMAILRLLITDGFSLLLFFLRANHAARFPNCVYHELIATEVEAVDIMIKLAQGNISQSELAFWLTHNCTSVT